MIRALFMVVVSSVVLWELLAAALAIAAFALWFGAPAALATGSVCAALKSYEQSA